MTQSVSIVVEWETVLAAGRERGVECLAAVNRQLWALAEASAARSEIIVCLDSAEVHQESVSAVLDQAHAGRGWPERPLMVVAPQLDYYQKKNNGFAHASGEIIVFVDSDVIPEPDWLANLLAAFADYRTSVVAGRTHLETRTLYERGVALFWIFDARDLSSAVRPTRRLHANNVAFRRAVLAHFPFPDRPTFRGQCSELASTLASRGILLYEHPAARARHPAPRGITLFAVRALHAGTDQYFYDAQEDTASLARCARQWRVDVGHVVDRIRQRSRQIGAGTPDIVAACVLGLIYYSTKAAGYSARVLQNKNDKPARTNAAAARTPALNPGEAATQFASNRCPYPSTGRPRA